MRLLSLLLVLLLPTAAFADEDEDLPPWDDPTGDDDDEDDDDDDDEAPAAEEAEEEAPKTVDEDEEEYASAPVSSGEYRSGSPIGLGFSAGTLNGFSLKIWPAQSHGIIFNVGVPNLLNSVGMHVGYRFHMPQISPRGSSINFHLYIGGNFRTRIVFFNNGPFVEIGGGVAVGAAMTVSDAPVEFWAEVVPSGVGAVVPAGVGVGFDVDGLVGVRFFPG